MSRKLKHTDVSDATPKRRQVVRFYGTFTPAKDGMRMKLIAPGPLGGTPIAGVTLRHNHSSSSKRGSIDLRVHR